MGTPLEHRAAQPPAIMGSELAHTQPNGYMLHSNGVARGQFQAQGAQHHHHLHALQSMQHSVKAQAPLDRQIAGPQHSNGLHAGVASHVPVQCLSATAPHIAPAVLRTAPVLPQAAHHFTSAQHEAGLQHALHVNSMPTALVRAATAPAPPPYQQPPNLQQQHVLLSSTQQPSLGAAPPQPTVPAQQYSCTPTAAPRHAPPPVPQHSMLPPHCGVQRSLPTHGHTAASNVAYQARAPSPHTATPPLTGQLSLQHYSTAPCTSTPGESGGRGPQAAPAAAVEAPRAARAKKISIRIKPFGSDRAAASQANNAGTSAVATVPQQNGVCLEAPPEAPPTDASPAAAPGITPKPAAKRKSRSKDAAPGKKQKKGPVHDYLADARKLTRGSCARVVFLSQHRKSRAPLLCYASWVATDVLQFLCHTDPCVWAPDSKQSVTWEGDSTGDAQRATQANCATLAGEQSEEEDAGESLGSLARNHNIQCHLDAVDRGGAVAGVSDPNTLEVDRWRRKCKSISRFEEAQAGAALRTSGRSRKSTKPQLQRGKVAVSMCTQIQEAARKQHRFVVRPSHIAGIGVYTKEALPAKQILLEYQGVIVRRVHADRLEDSYERAGKDHYLFAVDQSEYLVDATNQGGMARFVNHSCGPNCEVRTVSAEGVRRVVLVSLRAIRVGEELSYDYRLNPDPDKAIRCRCRSKRCRGWL